jgi:hypothetical protein
MKNTTLTNIISNFNNMSKEHFVEWFRENMEVLRKKEKEQIKGAYFEGRYFGFAEKADDYFTENYNKW